MLDCTLHVFEHTCCVEQKCKKCNEVLLAGKFVVIVALVNHGEIKKFLLGREPLKHCDETSVLFQTFETREEAEISRANLVYHMSQKRNLNGIWLVGWRAITVH